MCQAPTEINTELLVELQRRKEARRKAGGAALLPTTKAFLAKRTHEVFDLDAVQTTAQINRDREAASQLLQLLLLNRSFPDNALLKNTMSLNAS